MLLPASPHLPPALSIESAILLMAFESNPHLQLVEILVLFPPPPSPLSNNDKGLLLSDADEFPRIPPLPPRLAPIGVMPHPARVGTLPQAALDAPLLLAAARDNPPLAAIGALPPTNMGNDCGREQAIATSSTSNELLFAAATS